ncbi:MscS Mechanosensitive ion channel [Hallella multisaccharivorax DSM 17128]|uniref:MscS Mechanosensitive ion channel n=1 Tax=Hallella multisaccharivorax DSM 17128 TaxID=688246 RepID=F8N760_9BACT|nr:MscS Mechanosensitive ion channel [Hallella multisaccharivorax DSM 17128]
MNSHKAYILVLFLSLIVVLPTHAVLKERNIGGTLAMLRIELTHYHNKLEKQSGAQREQREQVMQQLIATMNNSQQNAIMLYSQKSGNVFDLTYACHEATEQYKGFKETVGPFRTYVEEVNTEIARYDSLITDLSSMYVNALTPKENIDRNVCLTLAVNIRRTLNYNKQQSQQYINIYYHTEARLKSLNDYANKRYAEIQASIFTNNGENFLTMLRNFKHELKETGETVIEKYKPTKNFHSDWDSRIIILLLALILFYGIIAAALSYLFIGFIVTRLMKKNKTDFILHLLFGSEGGNKAKDNFRAKRFCIILAATVITFAAVVGMVKATIEQNFLSMASGLLVEYAWLMAVVLLSLLIRLDGKQIRHGLSIYMPIMVMCFIVIFFRIVLIPNILTDLVMPPLLLIFTVWQWIALRRNIKLLPASDTFYAWVSFIVFLASDVASMVGYTLLSVEFLIWWTMQLTCILTIACASDLLKQYGNNSKRKFFDEDTPVSRTWFFRLIYTAVLPILGTVSILISIYWAADVFNLSDTSLSLFNRPLVNTDKFAFSIMRAVQAAALFFIAKYINHVSLHTLHYQLTLREERKAEEEKRKPSAQTVASHTAIWRNLIQVVIWGAWLLITLTIFHIDNSWIVAISAGLSTGIGFAMKDILENLYYGISLMAGRIKVGDYISIDGTKGTVRNISYTSTTVEALDGSVIAYQNSQLFSKNYKNLTRNHGNVLSIIPVGVSYGSKVPEVKQIIDEAVVKLNKAGYIKYIKSVLAGFGDNSIDFKILAWVDSRKQTYAEGDIMEAVYNAFNDKQIEIPFPQRDIHIVSDTAHLVKAEPSKIQHADSESEAEDMIAKK